MKIAIFSGIQKKTENLSIFDIYGTPQLYSYYLRKEFEKEGIETIPCQCPSIKYDSKAYENFTVPKADHILSVEQRGFHLRREHKPLFERIKESISRKVCTICDNNNIISEVEDLLFYAIPAAKKVKSAYVGWAADCNLCYADKNPNILRILIDHSYYGNCGNKDLSETILKDTLALAHDKIGPLFLFIIPHFFQKDTHF